MTRDELQLELRKISEMKKEAMRIHEEKLCAIAEAQQDTLCAIDRRKHDVLAEIAAARREADSVTRKANTNEQIRYKTECMDIEDKRQQLFADYKALPKESGDTHTA